MCEPGCVEIFAGNGYQNPMMQEGEDKQGEVITPLAPIRAADAPDEESGEATVQPAT